MEKKVEVKIIKNKEDFFASVCDYHFDRLLKMSDIEFEGMPDLGSKDLARKYREVMREQG